MRKITDKQYQAIINMRAALGRDGDTLFRDMPETLIEASEEIQRLKAKIQHNLMLGGTMNARHSHLLR